LAAASNDLRDLLERGEDGPSLVEKVTDEGKVEPEEEERRDCLLNEVRRLKEGTRFRRTTRLTGRWSDLRDGERRLKGEVVRHQKGRKRGLYLAVMGLNDDNDDGVITHP